MSGKYPAFERFIARNQCRAEHHYLLMVANTVKGDNMSAEYHQRHSSHYSRIAWAGLSLLINCDPSPVGKRLTMADFDADPANPMRNMVDLKQRVTA